MTGIDYFFSQRELAQLEGGFLNKVYDEAPGRFRLKFNKDGERNVRVELGKRIHLTCLVRPAPETQSSFTKLLRDKLGNARLVNVEQVGLDRVLKFSFANGLSLVLESFAKGNAFLLEENGAVLRPLLRDSSGRGLAKGSKYAPPAGRKSVLEAAEGDFDGEGGALEIITRNFGISSLYAREALHRAGIAEDAGLDGVAERRALAGALKSLCGEAYSPRICFPGEARALFSPIELQSVQGALKSFKSFGECLDEYYETAATLPAPQGKSAAEVKFEKAYASIAKLAVARKAFEEQIAERKAAGDWVVANCVQLDEAIAACNDGNEKRLAAALEGLRVKWKEERGKLVIEK